VIKFGFDHLGCLRVNALDQFKPGCHSLELLKAGDTRLLKRFPGAQGEIQTIEGILGRLRDGSGHQAHLLADQRLWLRAILRGHL